MCPYEYCEIFKNTVFYRTQPVADSLFSFSSLQKTVYLSLLVLLPSTSGAVWWTSQQVLLIQWDFCLCVCVKSVQIRSFSCSVFSPIWTEYGKKVTHKQTCSFQLQVCLSVCDLFAVFSPNTGKYGAGKTSYLETFHRVFVWSALLWFLVRSDNRFAFFFSGAFWLTGFSSGSLAAPRGLFCC